MTFWRPPHIYTYTHSSFLIWWIWIKEKFPLMDNIFKESKNFLKGKQLAPLCFPNSVSVLASSSVHRFCSIFATFPSWIWTRLLLRFCHRFPSLQCWHPVFILKAFTLNTRTVKITEDLAYPIWRKKCQCTNERKKVITKLRLQFF